MELHFGYGAGEQVVTVPDERLLGVLTANEMEHARTGREAVTFALEKYGANATVLAMPFGGATLPIAEL